MEIGKSYGKFFDLHINEDFYRTTNLNGPIAVACENEARAVYSRLFLTENLYNIKKKFVGVNYGPKIVSVIDELGVNPIVSKLTDIKLASSCGADEVEVCLSKYHLNKGDFKNVEDEINHICETSKKHNLAVTICLPAVRANNTDLTKVCSFFKKHSGLAVSNSSGHWYNDEEILDIALYSKRLKENCGLKNKVKIYLDDANASQTLKIFKQGASRIGIDWRDASESIQDFKEKIEDSDNDKNQTIK